MTERPPSLPTEQPAPWHIGGTSAPWDRPPEPAPWDEAPGVASPAATAPAIEPAPADPYDAFAPLVEDFAVERERPLARGGSVFGEALPARTVPAEPETVSFDWPAVPAEPETVPFDWTAVPAEPAAAEPVATAEPEPAAVTPATIAAPAEDDAWALRSEPIEMPGRPTRQLRAVFARFASRAVAAPSRDPRASSTANLARTAVVTERSDYLWFLTREPQDAAAHEADEVDPSSMQTAIATVLVAMIVIGLVIVFLLLFTSVFR